MLSDNNRELTITSNFEQAKKAQEEICREAQSLGYDEEVLFALRLSLEEALTNAICHGNGSDRAKKVRIRRQMTKERIDVEISDDGEGFNPMDVPDPTEKGNLVIPSGRGIHLMRAYMDEVEFNAKGTTVRLMKVNPNPRMAQQVFCAIGKLEMTTAKKGMATVITLSGSADMAEAGKLGRILAEAAESEQGNLVIDLSDLGFISSMGLGSLIKAQSISRNHGGKVILVNPQAEVYRVLKTTQLDQLFKICSSIEEAVGEDH